MFTRTLRSLRRLERHGPLLRNPRYWTIAVAVSVASGVVLSLLTGVPVGGALLGVILLVGFWAWASEFDTFFRNERDPESG